MRKLTVLIILFISLGAEAQDYVMDSWGLNSSADEQIPQLVNGGKTVLFTRGHHPENTGGKADRGDIWISHFSEADGWSEPEKLAAAINTPYYNGAFAYSNNKLLVYGEYRSGKTAIPGVSSSNVITWPDNWSDPNVVEVKYFKNSSANNGNSLSEDGKILMLSLESFKTRGAEDIYVSFWEESTKTWQEPKNLGSQINTPLQELTPFLAPDNKTLFFASNGLGGLGSRDIFVSQRLDDTWTNWTLPKNLGEGINTEGAEMGYRYYPELELAIYTSTKNSDGYGDIQIIPVTSEELNQLLEEELILIDAPEIIAVLEDESTPLGDNMVLVKGKISDLKTREAVFARTKIKGSAGFEQEHFNDTTYSFVLTTDQQYVLQIEADGYLSKQIALLSKKKEAIEIVQNVELEKIVIGARVKLANVLFVRGESEFLDSSFDELDLVVDMMLNNPSMVIELAGHTDNIGNQNLNKQLSQERVDAVINYLSGKEIDISRLSGVGYGGTQPIASNAGEATRRLNRRVEFIVVEQ